MLFFFSGILFSALESYAQDTAEIILHETVHGFIKINKDFLGISVLGNVAAHEYIFQNCIVAMRTQLMNAFGLSLTDATALSLQGLNDVLQIEYSASGNINSFSVEYNQFAIANYGMSVTEASAIFGQYLSGTKGTRCF